MENKDYKDPSYSTVERFEISDRPDCSTCWDSGIVLPGDGTEEFCTCAAGQAALDAFDEEHAPDTYEMSDVEADADTLASAGWGTDEDYGDTGYDGVGDW